MQLESFIEVVWRKQPGGYGFLGWKKADGWKFMDVPAHTKKLVVKNKTDLYFTPNVFKETRRQKHLVCPSRWLYADLDEVNPETLEWEPSLWWETSPGRYQGLWLLNRLLTPERHSQMNQKLTYLTNADRGGWGASKVLRVPGSISTKRGRYDIMPAEGSMKVYDAKELWRTLRDIPTAVVQSGKINFEETEKAQELIKRVPPKVRALIRRRRVRDRSEHVYLTVAELNDAGFTASETMTLLLTSPVAQEKYGARIRDELARVIEKREWEPRKEVIASTPADRKKGKKPKVAPYSLYRFLMRDYKPPQWIVKGIWADKAKGFVAGDPKTYKSTIVMDLALSVVTGKRFLGHFPVNKKAIGPVLYVDEENQSNLTQQRFMQVLEHKKLLKPGYIPMPRDQVYQGLHIRSKDNFRLTKEEDVDWLQEYVREYGIKLIVLDPLYYVAQGVDESSDEMVNLLVEMDRLVTHLDCGLLIVHHFKKQNQDNPSRPDDFQRMSGTGAMGRWFESILMVTKNSEGVHVHSEHRMGKGTGFEIDFDMDGVSEDEYVPQVRVHSEELQRLREVASRMTKKGPVECRVVAEKLGIQNSQKFRRDLESLGFHLVSRGHGKPVLVRRPRQKDSDGVR